MRSSACGAAFAALLATKHFTNGKTQRQSKAMWLQPYSVASDGTGVQLLVAKYKNKGSWLEYNHGAEREGVAGDTTAIVGSVRLVQVGPFFLVSMLANWLVVGWSPGQVAHPPWRLWRQQDARPWAP